MLAPAFRYLSVLLVLLGVTSAPAQVTPPAFSKAFSPNTVAVGGGSQLIFTIDNTDDTTPATDIAFTDNLPAGMVIAAVPGVTNTCTQGTVTAPAGGSTITFADGGVSGSTICTVSVNVVGTTAGTLTNTTGDLTSSAGNSGPATADLTVDADNFSLSKSFAPALITLGQRSRLTLDLDYSTIRSTFAQSIQFSDQLPPGMTVAAPSANISNTCPAGSYTITPGASQVSAFISFILQGDAGTCQIAFDVEVSQAGTFDNVTSNLTYSDSGNRSGGFATASLTATVGFLNKAFTSQVAPGGTVDLEFTIINFTRSDAAANIAFTDDLDAMLSGAVATGLPLSNVCGAGSQISGASALTFTGGSLPPEGRCTFTVPVSIPAGAAAGTYTNTTGTPTADVGGSPSTFGPAVAELLVVPAPLLTKEFTDDPVAAGGTVTLEFSVTNASTTSGATDIAFSDPVTDVLGTSFAPTDLPKNDVCGAGSQLSYASLGADRFAVQLSGGNLAASGSCTFSTVMQVPAGVSGGTYPSTVETISATVDGNTVVGAGASDDLVVVSGPQFRKNFTPSAAVPGGIVTLEFTFLGGSLSGDATSIAFTDDLNAFLTGAVVTGSLPTDPCGAGSTLTGTSTLTFSNGTLTAGEDCTFSVDVQIPASAAAGTYTNTTSAATSTVSGISVSSAAASDDLLVSPIVFTHEYIDDPQPAGGQAVVRYTIDNQSTTDDFTNGVFTHSYNTVLGGLVSSSGTQNDVCGSGSSVSGTSFLIVTGANLAPGTSCSFDVTLDIPGGAADGTYNSVTSNLTGNVGGNSVVLPTSQDALTVGASVLPLTFTKSFPDGAVFPGNTARLEFTISNPNASDSAVDIGFTDDLDAFISGATATGSLPTDPCGTGSTLSGTSTLTLAGGTLAGGADCTFDVTVDVPVATTPNTYINTTSTLAATIDDGNVPSPAATADLVVRGIETTVTAELVDQLNDVNGNSVANPFETITYTATITNTGSADAEDVVFTITPSSETPLQDGSVVTSGNIITGNTTGDTEVRVEFRSVTPGTAKAPVTVQFTVDVGTLPPFTTEVSNQGAISGANIAAAQTQDPDGGGATTTVADTTPLPVELSSFEAVVDAGIVRLTWETATEADNAGFAVEHTVLGVAGEQVARSGWKELGWVEGAGTTVEPRTYAFEIADLNPGVHRFRLKQVDFDGAFEYSSDVEANVELAGTHWLSEAYPNPFNPQTQFTLMVATEQPVTVGLYDLNGRLLQVLHNGPMEANRAQRFRIDGSALASGLYVYRAAGQTFNATGRVLLVK